MEKKHPILQKLDNYLSNVSEEQLQEDWKELKQYQEMGGPTMMEVLTPHPTIGIAECGSQYGNNSIDGWENLTPHPTIGIAECGSQYGHNSIDGWEMKHYYVYKDGHCLSDYDTFTEASEHSKRIDGDVFTGHTEPICWNNMSDEDKADFFIALTNPKK